MLAVCSVEVRCDALALFRYIQRPRVDLCTAECLLMIILGLKGLDLIITTKIVFVLCSKQVPEALCFVFCYFCPLVRHHHPPQCQWMQDTEVRVCVSVSVRAPLQPTKIPTHGAEECLFPL